jgi:predicted ATPase
VAFVSLASLGNPDLVVPAIGYAVGLREAGRDGWLRLLGQYLGERRMLIVLDNCEHVLDVAPEIAGLLADCPQLTILATSRAPLRVRGERVYQLGPLAVQADGLCSTLQEALASPAAQLFLERARDCDGRRRASAVVPHSATHRQRNSPTLNT